MSQPPEASTEPVVGDGHLHVAVHSDLRKEATDLLVVVALHEAGHRGREVEVMPDRAVESDKASFGKREVDGCARGVVLDHAPDE